MTIVWSAVVDVEGAGVTVVEGELQRVPAALRAACVYAAHPLPEAARCAALRRVAATLRLECDDLAAQMVEDVRKPIRLARAEVLRSADVAEAAASEWETMRGEIVPDCTASARGGSLLMTKRYPIGVVCAITPFNFPIGLTVHKLAPALVAGNACVVKPSEYATTTAQLLRDVFVRSGFPEEALPTITGGAAVVDALLAEPGVSLYSFTGSAKVGSKIKQRSGVRPVILELGSNAATIVHVDADLERAAEAIAMGAYAFAGQACYSPQRLIVHHEVVEQFAEKLVGSINQLAVGEPSREDVVVGPLINEEAATRVEAVISQATGLGARLICGGVRNGDFVSPAVLRDVPREARLWSEEVFGPVTALVAYSTWEEAIELANDTQYGLQAGVFTRDIVLAVEAAERLMCGAVVVNEASSWRATPMPFGGVKGSGFGREGPRYAIESMTFLKTTAVCV